MDTNVFESFIKEKLNEYSGGVKFGQLLVDVIDKTKTTVDADELLERIRKIEGISILEYSWDMGEVKRQKSFIYTK